MKKKFILILLIFLLFLTIFFEIFYFINNKQKKNVYFGDNFFSIIILPDTQNYVINTEYADIFTNQTQWIADNKNKLNIKFVIHEGDIVSNWNSIKQWERANKSMSILDKNNVPYSIVPGNHDHQKWISIGSTFYYNAFFPVSRFLDKEWFGGFYKNTDNTFQLITIEEQDYLFLSLDFCPENDELEWAKEILQNYSNRKTILTTHGYLNKREKLEVHDCGNTEFIWEDLIKNYKNIQIVLCGHIHGKAYRTDLNLDGKQVHQILADYQDEPNGGNGWLRILKFVPKKNKIYVGTYSPYLNKHKTNSKNQFVFDYEFI